MRKNVSPATTAAVHHDDTSVAQLERELRAIQHRESSVSAGAIVLVLEGLKANR